MWLRMIRAAKLDARLYEEVEHDRTANTQAAIVVVLAGLAAGIGGVNEGGLSALFFGTIAGIASWIIWAALTLVIGTRLFPISETEADFGQMIRTLGFATSPGVLRVFGVIPGLFQIVNLVVAIWMIATMVLALKQALDYTNILRAAVVLLIGFIVQMAVFLLLMNLA